MSSDIFGGIERKEEKEFSSIAAARTDSGAGSQAKKNSRQAGVPIEDRIVDHRCNKEEEKEKDPSNPYFVYVSLRLGAVCGSCYRRWYRRRNATERRIETQNNPRLLVQLTGLAKKYIQNEEELH